MTSLPDDPTAPAEPTPDTPPPFGAEREFRTDFSRHSVDYAEVLSGGPPKDGIPAIDQPNFETVGQADDWLGPLEPVILFQSGEDAHAYPLQILVWHEIVNDVVNGEPVLVTFCPLCNTAIAFGRTVNGRVLDFGTTGRLRYSNLIMYDRQTETWWQQASGEAIAGELTGTQLEFLPAPIIAWDEFKRAYPTGLVLSRNTGYIRAYGQNPYVGYDDINSSPFLYQGPATPDRLVPMARVLALDLNDEVVAFPYEVLSDERVVNESVGGEEVVVFWVPGTASALDSSALAAGRDVGTAAAYSRSVNGRALTFAFDGSAFIDQETGTGWDILGQAIDGDLAGERLTPVVAVNHFWFSWVAFKPETQVYQP
ncbi:MAG TPA: DUF3179 domain-containing protein [Anaerolineales bacterium]